MWRIFQSLGTKLPNFLLLSKHHKQFCSTTCSCTTLDVSVLYCTDHVLVQGGLSAEGFAAVAAGELGQHHGPRLLLARVVLQGHVGVLTTEALKQCTNQKRFLFVKESFKVPEQVVST